MVGFKKAVLRVGKYFSPDGEVPVTPDRLRHWQNEFRRMKAARQVIPVDWDHAEQSNRAGLTPLSLGDFRKRRSARNTVGHLVDFDVTDEGAVLTLDVPDEEAAGKADKNLVFVSPVISPIWRDGAANEYADCITHVDFVNHPVDHSQGPFERVPVESLNQQPAIACALRMGLGTQFYVPTNQGTKTMATKFLPQVIRLGDFEQNPEGFFTDDSGNVRPIAKKGRGGSSRGKRKKGRAAASRLSLAIRMAEDAEPVAAKVVPEGDYDPIDEILDMLEEFNIRLPDDTTDENLIERLRTALHTAMAHREDGAGAETPEVPPLESTEEPPIEETPTAMSLAASNAIRQQYRTSLQQRLQRLAKTGRCTDMECAARTAEIGTIKMSLAASGKPVRCELERWIRSREVVPAGTFWDETRRLSLQQNIMQVEKPKPEDPDKLVALQKMIFRGR
jgi:hypothetical protein